MSATRAKQFTNQINYFCLATFVVSANGKANLERTIFFFTDRK